jgi:hypothetical protein
VFGRSRSRTDAGPRPVRCSARTAAKLCGYIELVTERRRGRTYTRGDEYRLAVPSSMRLEIPDNVSSIYGDGYSGNTRQDVRKYPTGCPEIPDRANSPTSENDIPNGFKRASYASPEEWGRAGRNPGDIGFPLASKAVSVIDHPLEQKAAEHGLAARKHVGPSMFHMSDKQLSDLYAAGRSNMSYGFTIGKGGDQNMGLIDKAVSEGAVGSLLPPDLLPNASPLRLEPVRISEYFPQLQADGQSVSFVQHAANTLAADGSGMAVAENATKPTLGMTLSAKTTRSRSSRPSRRSPGSCGRTSGRCRASCRPRSPTR